MATKSTKNRAVYNSGLEEYYIDEMQSSHILNVMEKKEGQRNTFIRLRDEASREENKIWCQEQVDAIDEDMNNFVNELQSRKEED